MMSLHWARHTAVHAHVTMISMPLDPSPGTASLNPSPWYAAEGGVLLPRPTRAQQWERGGHSWGDASPSG